MPRLSIVTHATATRRRSTLATILALALTATLGVALIPAGSLAQASSPVTIHFLENPNPSNGFAWWKQTIAHFEAANPGIHVQVNYQPDQGASNTALQGAIAAGAPPDVAATQEGNAVLFAHQGTLLSLTPYIATSHFDTSVVPAGMVQEVTIGRDIYGLPFYAVPEVMIYNKALFAKAHVAPPASYKDELTVCRALQKIGVAHPLYLDAGGGYPGLGIWTAWGAFPLSVDGHHAAITSAAFRRWVQWRWDLAHTYGCIDPAIDAGKTANTAVLFATGKLALRPSGSYEFAQLLGDPRTHNFGVAPMESGPAGSAIAVGGSHLVIPRGAAHPDAAFKFISFAISSLPDQVRIALEAHDLPVNQRVLDDPRIAQQTPYFVPVLRELAGHTVSAPAYPWYYTVTYGPLWTQTGKLFTDPNPGNIAGYLQAAQAQSEALIAKQLQLSGQ